jgi:hypothetical protein
MFHGRRCPNPDTNADSMPAQMQRHDVQHSVWQLRRFHAGTDAAPGFALHNDAHVVRANLVFAPMIGSA